jgi:hypothetical protein
MARERRVSAEGRGRLGQAEEPRPNERKAPRPETSRYYNQRSATRAGLPDEEGYRWQIPTHTSNLNRPRTQQAAYNPQTRTLRVEFRDGTPWNYYEVEPEIWNRFQKSASPGRFINRVLNDYQYERASDWSP